ncbi:MAG TPA: tRNA (N(6)-L-threonylcarbamoyladenosine(37)-C(2))-methylthiotransferase MtaB [Dehalococcoidia bacterium]
MEGARISVAGLASETQAPAPASTGVRRVAILTLGCKLNQADSEAIARQLVHAGVEVIDRPAAADAYVINTCSVTHVADRKARKLVGACRRLAPSSPVIVTGCYVETAGVDIASLIGADVALPNRDKPAIAERIAALATSKVQLTPVAAPLRTRSFLKVQEGCNDVCAFCIVPRTRGREVSEPMERVVEAARERERDGIQEIVLTGTQLGAYGRDTAAGLRPADVIRAVLEYTSIPRVRFSSLQPQDITLELVALWEDPRLCRHFHLALQSGHDATLQRMRRRYSRREYAEAASRLNASVGDDLAITTDVIVGFPGESDEEFEDSLAFCTEMRFAAIHVFPYSRREGTTAAKLPGHVRDDVKRERVARMLAVGDASQRRFVERLVGRVLPVLWEDSRPSSDGTRVWSGLTDNYVRVHATDPRDLHNRITAARLLRRIDAALEAEAL